MTTTPFSGPVVGIRDNPLGSVGTGTANQNPQSAPWSTLQGYAVADSRYPFAYKNGGDNTTQKAYFFLNNELQVIDAVPSTAAAANIAASQSPGAGAITLVSSTAAGVTVGVTITRADNGATVTGLLALDSAMAALGFGQDTTWNVWDPTKAIARNVVITNGGNDVGITFTVTGYDIYGYPMSEAITGSSGATAAGKKAFKYITSVTHTGSVATTMSVGTGDVFGFGIRADRWPQVRLYWNNAAITANTGNVVADATTATTTTGDVRGTYATQSASDGTKRLTVYITPSAVNLGAGATVSAITGLFGVAQNLASNNGT